MVRYLSFFFLYTFCGAYSFAQSYQRAFSLKPSFGIPFSQNSGVDWHDYQYGLHLSYDKSIAHKDRDWIRAVHATNFSIGILWHNMQQIREVVEGQSYPSGHALGVLAEIDLQLFRLGNAKVFLTPGLGLTYITENIFTQPAMSTIGSHANMTLTGELSLEVPINQRTSLTVGAGGVHYSNVAIRIPNKGINTINASVGVKTAIGEEREETSVPQEHYYFKEGNSVELWLGAGVRGKYREKLDKFYRSGAYLGYNFYLNRAFSLKSGFHGVYYHSVFDAERFDETYQYYGSSYDPFRLGLAFGADFTMGRLVLHAMYGKYLHYNSYHDLKWYWVSGLRYFFTPNVGLQTTFNLHLVQADYTNWGIIVRW